MVAIEDSVFEKLYEAAKKRDITIQELFRAVIIPDWVSKSTRWEIPVNIDDGENGESLENLEYRTG